MAEYNNTASSELPGQVPGQYPTSPGETDAFATQQDTLFNRGETSAPTQTLGSTIGSSGGVENYGPDATLVGGGAATTGVAGYGVSEIVKDREIEQRLTGGYAPPSQAPVQVTVPESQITSQETNYRPTDGSTTLWRDGIQDSTRSTTVTETQPTYVRQEPTTVTEAPPTVVRQEEPRTVTETQPTVVRQEEPSYTRDAALVGGGAAATGAAGYGAYEATRPSESSTLGSDQYGAYDRSGGGRTATEPELDSKFATYGVHDSNPEKTEQMKEQIRRTEEAKARKLSQDYGTTQSSSTTARPVTTTTERPVTTTTERPVTTTTDREVASTTDRGDTSYGTAATTAGVAGAGTAGVAAASTSTSSGDYGAYERSGYGGTATEGELENKFATYALNDPNPEQTELAKEKIRRLEEEKKAEMSGMTSDSPSQEKKSGGLLSKLGLGGSKDKSETDTSTSNTASTTTTGAYEGESYNTSSLTKTASGRPVEPDREHILIQQADNPDAPVLVVKEQP